MATNFIAKIIYFIHILYLFLLIYLSIFGPEKYTYISIILISLMYFSWELYDNCPLNIFESYFRNSEVDSISSRLYYNITGEKCDNKALSKIIKMIFPLLLIISVLRFRNSCKIYKKIS
jgi:hypothetical protein